VKGDSGVFEIYRDGKPVFSKKDKDRFPSYQEVPMLMMGLGE
jgi:selT/selW/selH-like putative selenoprotein